MEGVLTAKVALAEAAYAIDKPYDYAVPPALCGGAAPGVRVMVPFGRGNRRSEGIILALSRNPAARSLKSLTALLDEAPVLDEAGLRIALWMRDRYFCTLYDAVKAMLPAGLWFSLKDTVKVAGGVDREAAYGAAARSEGARRLLDVLYANGGEADWSAVSLAFGEDDPGPAVRLLAKKNILLSETHALRGVRDKMESVVSLALPAEEALGLLESGKRAAPLRRASVQLLAQAGSLSVKELCYFTGASPATVKGLEKAGVVALSAREVFRRPLRPESGQPGKPIVLSREQEAAFEGISALIRRGEPAAALLRGVTGSGKTLVYIRLLERVLARGKTALVLVPEIALTPQLVSIFSSYFPGRIAVLHSSLRVGERYDEWKRIRAGLVDIVVGTRSAVFAPLKNLGLVVLDEEQEYSYKSENNPRYHARDIAKYRCARDNAVLLLGSATPAVETAYFAETGLYRSFLLSSRYNDRPLPRVILADMRRELKEGNGGVISSVLREELEENIRSGRQSILFLNRRGNSRMVACGECGWVPECPRCSVPLTYHSANGRLMCHYCGHSEKDTGRCPDCGGLVKYIGAGTQKVQEELEALFPGVEILRMDTDTVSPSRPHEVLLDRFVKEKIPVLVGTQMVAKGLDFENVTLVGVINADLSLYVDNFRARERTFSLLTQVVGRAGRGDREGRAVLQTFTPDNDVIRFAAAQDYEGFYDSEIALRRIRGFPPFSDLFTLTVSGRDETETLRGCRNLRGMLEKTLGANPGAPELLVLGPAPAPVLKVNNRYRYRLTLMGKNDRKTREWIGWLLRTFRNEKQNRNLSLFADSDSLE